MKTKTITLRLTVPAWLPGPAYWHRVKVAWKTLKFQFRPFYCIDCGTKIDFRFPDFEYQAEGKRRVILHQSGHKLTDDKRGGVCGCCLSKRIAVQFEKAKPLRGRAATYGNGLGKTGTRKLKCDACGETKPTMDVCWEDACDIRFGSGWWNGHNMCKDCLCETAERATPKSSVFMYFGGKSYPTNTAGAVIGLPWWKLLLKEQRPPLRTLQEVADENKTTTS